MQPNKKLLIYKRSGLLSTSRKVSPNTCTQIDKQPTYNESFVPKCVLFVQIGDFYEKGTSLIFQQCLFAPKGCCKDNDYCVFSYAIAIIF